MLIRQLPPESATATALRLDAAQAPAEGPVRETDPEAEQWSRMEQLLASVRDELHFLRHAYSTVHSKQKPQWKPEALPRPGVKPRRRPRTTETQAELLWVHLQRFTPPEP